MKKTKLLFIFGIAVLPFLAGCPETENVTTKINRDGSCIRTIGNFDPRKFKGIDSIKFDVPVPIDNSWLLENINDSTAVLLKVFESVGALNSMYSDDESALKVYKRKVELIKKFRWFYTVFEYSETYKGILTEIPITNYMTKEEAESFKMDSEEHPLLAGLDAKARNSLIGNIEERFGYWLHDNIYSLAFDDIIRLADSLHIIDLDEIRVKTLKDSISKRIDEGSKKMISLALGDDLEIPDLAELMGVEMGLDSADLSQLYHRVQQARLDEKYEKEILSGFGADYNNEMIMPGQLIDTNAEIIREDTLAWEMDIIKFMDSDFVMHAESKVTNQWAYIVSGFIVVVALIIPFLRRKRTD
ncbi:MAG: hypothetical protein MI975_18365 [Cytophagales bacterium]|nr:hypothetical protein [Cytophagales bacterium]